MTVPEKITALPRDHTGRPVPWFVAWIDGTPDFRVVGPGKLDEATRFDLCWVCGGQRGRYGSFVIGPMCAISRVSAEPPSHHTCATYSAQVCPFLTTPTMRRRENRIPEGTTKPAGEMIARNPGVALVWASRTWRPFPVDGGLLWNIGDPTSTEWYAQGRAATRAEVLASIDSGLPLLQEVAERDGVGAVRQLERQHIVALSLVPKDARADNP